MSSARLALAFGLLTACGARTGLTEGRDGSMASTDAGAPSSGCPRVLARDALFEVEVDDRFVYYSTGQAFAGDQRYRRVPKCGGEAETILEDRVGPFTLDGGYLYFTSFEGLERVRTDGSGRELLYRSERFAVGPFAIGAREIFFCEPAGAPERTLAVPKDGGAAREVAAIGGLDLTADATHVYLASWMPGGMGFMARVPIDGGEVERLGPIRETIRDLVVDGRHLYWSDSADSAEAEIFRAAVDGSSSAPEVVFRGPGLPLRLGVGGAYLYFTNHTGDALERVPLGGGPREVLDRELPVAEDLALDEARVYAVSFRDRTLIQVPR
ncbi:MAG: hypothetical protein H6719_11600 [Sandaracinaceae bacterium]|nr:hypothetical protein [Sandaracinaceae bacterium]